VLLVSISDSNSLVTSKPQPIMDGPSEHISHPLLGDMLALISAIFYALYVILLKVRIRAESRVDMQLFFGFVGLFNIILCWPIGIVLHLTGTETLELPTTMRIVSAILINVSNVLSLRPYSVTWTPHRCLSH
jgi:solute carrier family 35 protein F5